MTSSSGPGPTWKDASGAGATGEPRVPGERPPARLPGPASGDTPTRLERPPGERYADAPSTAVPGQAVEGRVPAGTTPGAGGPGAGRALAVAIGVAVVGGVILTLLELLDLGAGLIAVGFALGWTTGLAVRAAPRSAAWARTGDRRSVSASLLALLGSVLGFALIWVWSRALEGGVLGPAEYLGERFGPLPLVLLVVAGGAAALRAR